MQNMSYQTEIFDKCQISSIFWTALILCFLGSTEWKRDINKNHKVQEITETESEHKKKSEIKETFCEETPATILWVFILPQVWLQFGPHPGSNISFARLGFQKPFQLQFAHIMQHGHRIIDHFFVVVFVSLY